MNLKNKKVWITGASSGIGEGIATTFAKEGCYLILSGRNTTELERVKKECVGASGVEIVQMDLSKHDEIFKIADALIGRLEHIDILVNNAGISQRSLAKDTKFEVDKFIIDVDLLGTIALTKAVIPSMIAKQSGDIIVMSSLMGKFGTPLRSSYAAAKHGLHGFFDSLRAELFKDNIQVLMVCPGFVQTNISLNAVVADGSKQGTMDAATEKGLPTTVVAQKIIKALNSNKEEINVGGKEVAVIYLKRFFPKLVSKFIRKIKVT